MTAREQLFALYTKCFEQRAVLTEAPPLTITITDFTIDNFDETLAQTEISKLMSYLLSVRNAATIPVKEALNIVEKTYSSQPFWKNLILDYLEYRVQKEAESLAEKAEIARKEAAEVLRQIREREAHQRAMIKAYADPLKEQKFAIDAQRLILNYMNMSRKDAKRAWEELTTNPGYFSPIITTDKEGNTVLTPDQARAENKKIAKFLKGLSV